MIKVSYILGFAPMMINNETHLWDQAKFHDTLNKLFTCILT